MTDLPTKEAMGHILDATIHAKECEKVLRAYADGRLIDLNDTVDGPVYRTNFGPTDDGSNDTREAHDAWMEVQDLVRDDWLVEVGEASTP